MSTYTSTSMPVALIKLTVMVKQVLRDPESTACDSFPPNFFADVA